METLSHHWHADNPGKKLDQYSMMSVAHSAFEKTFSRRETVISGFRKCGLVPWNPMAVDVTKLRPGSMYSQDTVDMEESSNVGTAATGLNAVSEPLHSREKEQEEQVRVHQEMTEVGDGLGEQVGHNFGQDGELASFEATATVEPDNVTPATNFMTVTAPLFPVSAGTSSNHEPDIHMDILPTIINGSVNPVVPIPQLTEEQGMNMN